MRRRVLIAAIFLLAGAVVNVAVAWIPAWEYTRFLSLGLRPIVLGFIVNTIVYAAILWLIIPGPFALRRLIRRRRGLCPACGYDLRHVEHGACPECGVTA